MKGGRRGGSDGVPPSDGGVVFAGEWGPPRVRLVGGLHHTPLILDFNIFLFFFQKNKKSPPYTLSFRF